MFDINQPRIERLLNEKFGIPVLHYPQLLGLAMGLTPEELALDELRVDATKIQQKLAAKIFTSKDKREFYSIS